MNKNSLLIISFFQDVLLGFVDLQGQIGRASFIWVIYHD